MSFLLAQYWTFIVLAALLGLFVGWATSGDGRAGGAVFATLAVAAGLALARRKLVPGLAGHLLEVALLLCGGYGVGCVLGAAARSAGTRENRDPGNAA
jgi:hypothetical protein